MAIQEATKAKGVQEASLGLRKHLQESEQVMSGVPDDPVSVPLESIIRGAKAHSIRATLGGKWKAAIAPRADSLFIFEKSQ